ncbi:MAG: DNA mismatch repair protein MutS [Christensenellales bacterium]|jgi:DNA mismatch repair protein MutS
MQQLTPMMRQYVGLKEKYKDCLLMYRLGDFYELFFDDAICASRELEITLTGRDCGLPDRAPMCGVPYHSVQGYIDKLIKKGYKVAICEQLTDPASSQGIVERDVVRIITPGTVTENTMLSDTDNNYILSLFSRDNSAGIAYADVSTGAFYIGEYNIADDLSAIVNEISRVLPSEIIYCKNDINIIEQLDGIIKEQNIFTSGYPVFTFQYETAMDSLLSHFKISNLLGYGISENNTGINAAGALIDYLKETQKNALSHISTIQINRTNEYMALDMFTRNNLELTRTLREGKVKGSLLGAIDRTKTAMGARLLKRYINEPLQNLQEINDRLDAVQEFMDNRPLSDRISSALDGVFDLERLISRIAYATLDARNCLALKKSLEKLPELKKATENCTTSLMRQLTQNLDCMDDIFSLLDTAIDEDAPAGIADGHIIKNGYNVEIDELKQVSQQGKVWIASLENSERQNTGIKNLKVGYNKVFGYYIEVTKSYLELVPYRYIRKQTLTNCERFVTPELKEMEEKILNAQEKCVALEYECFVSIRNTLADNIKRFQNTARIVAIVDVLQSFGAIAYENHYVRPDMTQNGDLYIAGGRHPVVEKFVTQSFIKNDTSITTEENIMILTGPNMAGKSTYMRQVALIVLMAHIGCFIPADSATICIVDKIFTRVGASDNLASGQSTFMVEMNEVANILNNATSKSLLILDEIGRGTSTIDGLSIAWSVVEYISQNIRAKTLFATHFHELTELEGTVPGVSNYSITVREIADTVVFLHKIVRGGTDKSFGIEVAKLAGVPLDVTERAKTIMQALIEKDEGMLGLKRHRQDQKSFDKDDLIKVLREANLDNMTPLDSLKLLCEIKHKL